MLLCGQNGFSKEDWDDDWENGFNDQPVIPEIVYPQWFKQSFLELPDDINDAVKSGKKGIIVYFGQKHCAYCQALIDKDFGQPDIEAYTRKILMSSRLISGAVMK